MIDSKADMMAALLVELSASPLVVAMVVLMEWYLVDRLEESAEEWMAWI